MCFLIHFLHVDVGWTKARSLTEFFREIQKGIKLNQEQLGPKNESFDQKAIRKFGHLFSLKHPPTLAIRCRQRN